MKYGQIIGPLVGLGGMTIVWVAGDWWVAVGVFFMLMGNNLERSSRQYDTLYKIFGGGK